MQFRRATFWCRMTNHTERRQKPRKYFHEVHPMRHKSGANAGCATRPGWTQNSFSCCAFIPLNFVFARADRVPKSFVSSLNEAGNFFSGERIGFGTDTDNRPRASETS